MVQYLKYYSYTHECYNFTARFASFLETPPDFLETRGSLQFEEQNTVECISITIFEDTLVETTETLRVELGNPRNIPGVELTTTNVPVNILENDSKQ